MCACHNWYFTRHISKRPIRSLLLWAAASLLAVSTMIWEYEPQIKFQLTWTHWVKLSKDKPPGSSSPVAFPCWLLPITVLQYSLSLFLLWLLFPTQSHPWLTVFTCWGVFFFPPTFYFRRTGVQNTTSM